MNRNYIFVFILLVATFSMINAVPHQLRKRETKFGPCGAESLTVNIVPDPPVSEKPVTYTGSGTLKFNNIIAGKTIFAIGYGDTAGKLLSDPYYQNFTESYNAGEPFTITAKNVPTPKLPKTYVIEVDIFDIIDNPKAPLYACASTTVGGTPGEEVYPIAGYPIAGYPIAERS
ncbi:uncharacterized protein OCT59_003726 [Rhizophagus irregularis]|uniref:MD-2-related lipid-recognition domain-containing protein n=3 Tax=Rhizophagus irregularis TaxID=588596 RepID=A0A2P4PH97_RHIID|nr:hypothetical protein GLOIN_2v1483663 [Rhizophagus irregularis DAOM 181602=DAOM 197198]POG64755.1 hypothetical protein GLOIN_2v1483663 [Rhizophagus irregularis DAOM 181602=DAOM 197198]UZO12178.1 hypothetical protein OCT59_003726 [Rhizophagus irregularis]GBC17523.2 hypothetical protein GLOIN_2v1483663 [Rhizophagus irregularis DAOM 181602=DAOM 197198]|eukprot:XP_025171621.1 hypothetical protein GLOIN_2v1483663 [Rhizophagus irregularis DAOM 181602=DAOM 197198]